MVMTCTPNSCTGRIFSDTNYLFTTYSAIASIAQKIAGFVTEIFATIANFVGHCLGTVSGPNPTNTTPAVSGNILSVVTTTPTTTVALPPARALGVTPANTSPVNAGVIESGKQILRGLIDTANEVNAQNTFCAGLDTEESGRRTFATLLMYVAITLSIDKWAPFIRFVNEFNPKYRPIRDLLGLKRSFSALDEPLRSIVLQIIKGELGDPEATLPAVADFLTKANHFREQFTQDPIFRAAADAARAELLTQAAAL